MNVRIVIASLTIALIAAASPHAIAGPDVYHMTLIDQVGKHVRLADLAGRPVAITFVATRCTDGCPIANAAFAQLDRRLKRERIAATLLTITLDPEHDSPLAMARLAANFGADASRWHFLSGTPEDIHALMRAFDVRATPGADGIPDEHTSFVYLLDAHGRRLRDLLLSTALANQVPPLFEATQR